MLVWLSAMLALHWGCAVGILGLACSILLMSHQRRIHARQRRWEQRLREEFDAYAHLDARLREDDDIRELAQRVCRLVSRKSAFQRVAMLAYGGEGRLFVASSVGMEEQMVHALHEWGERVMEKEGASEAERVAAMGVKVGSASYAVVLGKRQADIGCGRAVMIPFWTSGGQIAGALAVCADRLVSMPRNVIKEAIRPLEALAVKLGREIESANLAEGLGRAEKLTGLGLLASGVAHALSNPLTTVLGFSELIAETTNQARVRADAEMIGQEARRMRDTVQNLLNFGRPVAQIDETVEIAALVKGLADECKQKLEDRGVQLALQVEDELPGVRGNGERLREVLEHLLNNAAQSIAIAAEEDAERAHEIRVSVSRDGQSLQMIVSDTGTGFEDPGRVFDPFQKSRQPGQGAGVGLGICYGIVQEHGGEINAFNLQPYGAAVVVELPLKEGVVKEFPAVAREVA